MNKKKVVLIVLGVILGLVLIVIGTQYLSSRGITLFKTKELANKAEDDSAVSVQTKDNMQVIDFSGISPKFTAAFNYIEPKLKKISSYNEVSEAKKYCVATRLIYNREDMEGKFEQSVTDDDMEKITFKKSILDEVLADEFGPGVSMSPASIEKVADSCMSSKVTYNANTKSFSEIYPYDDGYPMNIFSDVDYKIEKIETGKDYINVYGKAIRIEGECNIYEDEDRYLEVNSTGETFGKVKIYNEGIDSLVEEFDLVTADWEYMLSGGKRMCYDFAPNSHRYEEFYVRATQVKFKFTNNEKLQLKSYEVLK